MADFSNPKVGSNYTSFPAEIRASVDASLQMLSVGSHSNIPTGTIKWDASAKRFKKYNGSSFDNITDEFLLDANVNLNRADFGDNDQARFGNSQQLKIYYGGSNAFIDAGGASADLIIKADDFFVKGSNDETLFKAIENGSCELYEDGTKRLETDGNGIQVTSRVGIGRGAGQALDVEGNAQIGTASTSNAELKVGRSGSGDRVALFDLIGDNTYSSFGFRIVRNNGSNATSKLIQRGTGDFELVTEEAANIIFKTDGTQRATITSAGRLGVGVTNPDTTFHAHKGSTGGSSDGNSVIAMENNNHCILQMLSPNDKSTRVMFGDPEDANAGEIQYNHSNNDLMLQTAGSERARLTSAGRLGISTSDPQVTLDVGGASSGGLNGLTNSVLYAGFTNNTNFGGVVLGAGSNGNTPFIAASKRSNGNALSLDLITDGTKRISIKTDGDIGVGTTSISSKFHIADTSGNTILELQRTNTNATGSTGTINFTALDGHSVGSISAVGDGDNEGANIVFRTTSAAANNDPYNAATPIRFTIRSDGNLIVPDNGKLIFGTGNGTNGDLQIFHDTSNTYIDCPSSGTGHLIIKADDFLVQGSNAESMIKAIENAGVELFHNNSSKFFTTSTGAVVSGRLGVGTETSPSHTVDIKSADNTLLLLESTDRHALLEIHDTGGNIALGNDEGKLRLMTGGSDRVRINSSGLGIGTTSPDHTLEIRQSTASHQIVSINRANSNVAALYLGNDSSDTAKISVNGDNNLSLGKDNSGTFTQHFLIDSDGNLFINNDKELRWGSSDFAYIKGNDNSFLAFGVDNEVFRCSENALRIGQTSDDTVGQDDTNVGASIEKNGRISSSTSGTVTGLNLNTNATSSLTSKHYISFRKGGSQIASITCASGGDGVNLNYGSGGGVSTSDKRLKENIVDFKNALSDLLKLKPKKFNFISDSDKKTHEGLIAQDVKESKVSPHTVFVDNTEEKIMSLNYEGFITLAIAAIQELAAKVQKLESA